MKLQMFTSINPLDKFKEPELEAGLLRGLVKQPEVILPVKELLSPADFTSEAHQQIFEALSAGLTPNLEQLGQAEPPADLLSVAQELKKLAQYRDIEMIAAGLREDVKAGKTPEEIIPMAQASLLQLNLSSIPVDAFRPMSQAFPGLLEDYRQKQKRRAELGNVGLTTHIPRLNRTLGGLQPGIHTLAAPPGMGKTTLVLNLGIHIASEGYPVLFLSFEESMNRLTLKALCQLGQLSQKSFTHGQGYPEELIAVMDYHGHKLENLFIVEGRPGISVQQVKAWMLRAMQQTGKKHGLIIVDYLQVWAAIQKEARSDAFRHDVSALMAELRRLSLDLQIPILAISSQSRRAYQGSVSSDDLSSLKESGELEYTADTAWFLIENKESPGLSPKMKALTLSITKNRFGDTDKIPLLFNKEKGIVGEAAD